MPAGLPQDWPTGSMPKPPAAPARGFPVPKAPTVTRPAGQAPGIVRYPDSQRPFQAQAATPCTRPRTQTERPWPAQE